MGINGKSGIGGGAEAEGSSAIAWSRLSAMSVCQRVGNRNRGEMVRCTYDDIELEQPDPQETEREKTWKRERKEKIRNRDEVWTSRSIPKGLFENIGRSHHTQLISCACAALQRAAPSQ